MRYQCASRRNGVEVRMIEKEQAKEGTWDTNIYFILVSFSLFKFYSLLFFLVCNTSSSMSSFERAGAAFIVCGPVFLFY